MSSDALGLTFSLCTITFFPFLLSADFSISVTPENMIIKVHQAALTVIDIIEILPIVLFPENYYENRYFGTEL